ncbi:MAG: hypothetical protein MPJ22_09770 [Pirellulales bacterium]|nr:hypothetical protein [Pirellulales bacterium]MDA8042691.1 hypothetical protein [Pirellulales bacterium]
MNTPNFVSIYKNVISPKGDRYNNSNEDGIVLNSVINETDFKFTNRLGIVKTPAKTENILKEDDEVIVHHNVFRRFFDVYGKLKDGGSYIRDNVYACHSDQIFAYRRNGEWKSYGDFCFIKPIKSEEFEEYEDCVGTVFINHPSLEVYGIKEGDKVYYIKGGEYKFDIEGEIYYRMLSRNVKCLAN